MTRTSPQLKQAFKEQAILELDKAAEELLKGNFEVARMHHEKANMMIDKL